MIYSLEDLQDKNQLSGFINIPVPQFFSNVNYLFCFSLVIDSDGQWYCFGLDKPTP